MARIPLNDLLRHTDALGEELLHVVDRVVRCGWYVLGPEVEAFEREFAAYCGAQVCVSVGNGTDALELALRALGVRPGDAVATVANAGMYSTTAIRAVGAHPVFIDVDPRTYCMCVPALAAHIGRGLRAAVLTHLYGRAADVIGVVELTRRCQIPVIEDCAQAHGARVDGRHVGTFGQMGCFSFYPTKNLGALGDGGAIITNSPELGTRLRELRQYGWRSKYRAVVPNGRNSRLDEIQAAVLRLKLKYLDSWNERRRAIAAQYTARLRGVIAPQCVGPEYVAHLYVVRTAERDQLRARLAAAGVVTDVHYPVPDYRQEALSDLPGTWASLPVTEQSCAEVLTLPCFPELTDREVDEVVEVVNRTV
jgi:dTDP-4-amino-4,6-dideoxygalactose transaminase